MLNSQTRPHVAFSVTNCICHDQRVLKIAGTVSELNCDITLIGRMLGDCCKNNQVPFATKRFKMVFKRGFLFYKFFNIRLFFYLLTHKFDLLVSNDLDTLLPNYIVSFIKRLPLIYDTHEYFTGVPEIQDRPIVKGIWKTIESFIFPKLKTIITVSNSVAQKYFEDYGIMPVTVMNCSQASEHIMPFSREGLGIKKEDLIVVFQGTGINIDRGGEELVKAVLRSDKITLLVIGSGSSLANMQILARGSDKIKFIGTLPWEKMMQYTRMADVGISLDKDTNINHRFSLPNKLFDYISAGIAIVVSDLPEVKKLISDYGCGIVIEKVTPEIISETLDHLVHHKELLEEYKMNSFNASQKLNWKNESIKIRKIYEDVIHRR
jgi:glycosyltransferase involved in cell wall biosynthesis